MVRRAAVAVVAGVVLSTLVFWQRTMSPEFKRRADGLFVPRTFAPLLEELKRNGRRHVFAGYRVVYRLDFETDERLVAAEATLPMLSLHGGRVVPDRPTGLDESRHAEYDAVVRADPDAGFVLLREPPPDRTAEDAEDVRWRRLLERAGTSAPSSTASPSTGAASLRVPLRPWSDRNPEPQSQMVLPTRATLESEVSNPGADAALTWA